MVMGPGARDPRHTSLGIDRTKLRLAVIGVLLVAAFTALFSRLWFLQVLAADQYAQLAKENRIRLVHSEPTRGRILDRDGKEIVTSRQSLAVTIDRTQLRSETRTARVLGRLSRLLDVKVGVLEEALNDTAASPYKPVPVAYDITENQAGFIEERSQRFRGVVVEDLPVRVYPHGELAAHILGYVREIGQEDLELDLFKNAKPAYLPGDLVGKSGVERIYDRYLRGRPEVQRVVVNSSNDIIRSDVVQEEEEGRDLVLSLDIDIQKVTERALANGILAARSGYQAPAGAAVVMDPNTGGVVAMASYPTYDGNILADIITHKELRSLGAKTPDDPDDDALLNRAIQAQRAPGSTFKAVTAGAALSSGVADTSTLIDCPGSAVYPPEGGPGSVIFRNWTSISQGSIGFPKSLEVSCDTFYYELGWRMETTFDERELFQKYAREAGLGHETGIDLPNEADGRIPDRAWCEEAREATLYLADDGDSGTRPTCADGWLPGFSVNMAIGQGDVIVTPLQMAVTYAAIANGGSVMQPRLGWELSEPNSKTGLDETMRAFKAKTVRRLPLDVAEIEAIRDGLEDVISGAEGTARGAFAGFPTDRYALSGKTGTAELGESDLQDAWFVSYGPSDDPQYVIAVYVEKAGHGGETAAPIARQIWEGIFNIDEDTSVNVQFGADASG